MNHFTDGKGGETLEQEREALMADIVHFREQCKRYTYDDASGEELGGVVGLMTREKTRLYNIMHCMGGK
jgi:hypothetical protein